MLRRLNDYQRLTLEATNGEIGQAEDFLFDEEQWAVRYVVLSKGSLFARRVAVSPISLVRPDWDEGRLRVSLTRDQLRDSPDLFAADPIPRSAEEAHAAYYGYPAYWGGPSLWAWSGSPGALASPPPSTYAATGGAVAGAPASRLHGMAGLRGVHLQVNDGEIGHVDDLLLDDETWRAPYLLVDTSNWPGGTHVLVPTWTIDAVDWIGRHVQVHLLKEQVEHAPHYQSGTPIDDAGEAALTKYYGPGPAASERGAPASEMRR